MDLSSNWDNFVDTFTDGARVLARNTLEDTLEQAEADARSYLEDSKDKLRRWGDALSKGELTRDDFEFLVGGQRDLAKMRALKAVGVSQTRLERFRTGLVNLATQSAFDAIGL